MELRTLIAAMLPRVGLPEVILEVMSRLPGFVEAFTAVSGGQSRLAGLDVTIAACLAAHALNIGFDPIVKKGVQALQRDRVSHVDQNYMLCGRKPVARRETGRHRARPSVGRRDGRRHRRDVVHRHWPDILRVVASIYAGAVRAYDVTRVLQRDGNPTPLGEAIQAYGRIFKSLHILACVDDEPYRRDIKAIRNLQEERHSLAALIFHGKKGELYHRYHAGMEDQLSALGLVLNCVVLWNTVYMNAALEELRARGHPVRDEDVARLSPFLRRHLGVHGDYSFLLPALAGQLRELRDPNSPDGDEED